MVELVGSILAVVAAVEPKPAVAAVVAVEPKPVVAVVAVAELFEDFEFLL